MIVKQVEKKGNNQVELLIQVEQDAWQSALQKAYEAQSQQFPVAGFEAGQAPRAALEAQYGDDCFYQEAVNETFPPALVEAVRQENLQLIAAPTLRVETIGPEGYTFAALAELYPEVKLGTYKGLSAHRDAVELSEDDTESAVADFLRQHKTESAIDGPAAAGDTAVIDFEGFTDGVAFEGGKGERYPLVLGSGSFIPGFEEQVCGMRVGETREIHVAFPSAYTPELAGKDAMFRVTVHELRRSEMPELTEAFARGAGFGSVSELRQNVMMQLLESRQQEAQDAFEDALIEQVLDGMEVEIPESMVQNQLDGLMRELEGHLQSQGIGMEEYLSAMQLTREQVRQQIRQSAESSARFELAMNEIAQRENFSVTEEELSARYKDMAALYGMPEEHLRKELPPEALAHDLKITRARQAVVNTARAV